MLALARQWSWSGTAPWREGATGYTPPAIGEAVKIAYWWGLDTDQTHAMMSDEASAQAVEAIDARLEELFPAQAASAWMRTPNPDPPFAGSSPAEYAQARGLSGLTAIHGYLTAHRNT